MLDNYYLDQSILDPVEKSWNIKVKAPPVYMPKRAITVRLKRRK